MAEVRRRSGQAVWSSVALSRSAAPARGLIQLIDSDEPPLRWAAGAAFEQEATPDPYPARPS